MQGPITIAGYEHIEFDVVIERVEPEQFLSYRWHPYAMDPAVDYSKEQRTLVAFTLKEAFRMNSRGWEGQMRNIQRHATAG